MSFPFDFPEDVATLLAQICCHKNQLPQGAPTSPVLSNFICRGMDRDLAKLARAERCYFTRYADDLTFSTNRRVFPGDLAYSEGGQAFAGQALTAIVKHAGFMINERKTRLLRYTQRQRVTGLVVNRQLNIPRDYVRSLRNLLYVGNRYGLAAAENAFSKTAPHPNWPPGKRPAPFLEAVRGRVQYVGSIKGWGDPVYKSLARSLAQLDPSFQYPVLDQPPTSPTTRWRFYVCTEGETDVKHLVAALSHYHQHGNFIDLALEFDNRSSFRGHSELQKHLRHLPASKPSVPTVCLFDRDAEAVLREEGLRQADYSDRGNGVVAAALVTPDFRAEDKRVCIEMLYRDEDLAIKDADGRRVYLRSEFDNRTNQHKTEQCNLGEPKKDTLIRDDVYEFGTGRSLALSKMRFAQSIEQHQPPFDRVSFEGFEPTLRMLQKAAREVANKIL